MAKEDSAGTWPEVCQKVAFGDGLYRTCREKVPGFDGFQNSRFDASFAPAEEEEDFTSKLMKSAVKPPSLEEIETRHLAGGDAEDDDEEEPGFIESVMQNPWLLYGGLALVVYLLFFRRQEIVTTETPQLPPPTITPQKPAG